MKERTKLRAEIASRLLAADIANPIHGSDYGIAGATTKLAVERAIDRAERIIAASEEMD